MRKYYCCREGFHTVSKAERACWVDIIDPDEDDVKFLTESEGVPRVFLEYLADKEERPRVERDGEWMMTIIRIPVKSEDHTMPYKTVPLGVISKVDDRMITICYHRNTVTSDFAEHTVRKAIMVTGVSDFTLRIFYSSAYWYLSYLKSLSEKVMGAEKALEKTIENDDLLWLMRMQKSLVFFNTSIKGDMMVLERIHNIFSSAIDPDFLEDVEIELRQADSTVAIYTDILESTMDAYASIISNNMNNVMKRMTGLTLILMVPTFIASLYGMNVDILISGNKFAFWIVILIATVLTAIAFLCLRRIKWV